MDSESTQLDAYSSFPVPCSSSTPRWRYDVFISFRGEDTRKNFTDHLYMALVQSGIHTFRDDDELPRGQEISSELLKAIQESRISIVVFSKNYGDSRWCLDELVEIMDCRKKIGQLVLPVFYDVDPSDVRKQKGSFEAAFAEHEERYVANAQKVLTWKAALTEAANLSGWDLQDVANGYEGKFIKKIVDKVLQEVNHTYLHVAKYPVGLESHNQKLNSMLVTRNDDVLFLGIYGLGGIGKTTIAKHFYNSAFQRYEASCFLANVREGCGQPNGIVHLQEKLLSEMLMKRKITIANVDTGISLMKQRLASKRVLIVLDDLDQSDQIESLAGDRGWFGKGSLIIITTRNQDLLDQARVDVKYEVKELNHEKSVTLFSWHAFESPVPFPSYTGLLENIVRHAGGLPLALEVLGSSLVNKSLEHWKAMLEKLKVIPHNKIQAKLKISYEALEDDTEKDIFLDIACFFIGMDKDYAIKIFDGCDFFGEVGINTLVSRCLVKIISNKLHMHDLVRDMGRGIVRESSPKMPGKRSRLWQQDDVLDVLTNNKGTEEIEGIILDLPMQTYFSTRPFTQIPNLRLLKINNVTLDGSFEGLFEELRWLCWHGCELESFPSDLHLQQLVCLDMQYSNLTILWNGIKFLGNLKEMDLGSSWFLTKTPDFSEVPNLERLSLCDCVSLSNIDPSIGILNKLKALDLRWCFNLKSLPSTIGNLTSLKSLNVSDCSNLERLPEQFGDMKRLIIIDASYSGIKELPDSIGNLCQLEFLWLNNCESLTSLPNSIGNLRSLALLEVKECSNMQRLPEQLENMECLSRLSANRTAIKQLPHSIGFLHNLEELYLDDCNLSDADIPDNLPGLSSLRKLDLSGNNFCSLPASIAQISGLGELHLNRCTSLHSILDLPRDLWILEANDCTSLEQLPNLSNLDLGEIYLRNCSRLLEIEGLEYVYAIDLDGCDCNLSTTALEIFLLQEHFEQAKLHQLNLSRHDIPDCFEYQGTGGSAISFNVPDDLSDATIWLDYDSEVNAWKSENDYIRILVNNKTREDRWTHEVLKQHKPHNGSFLIHVPRYQIKSGDSVEVSFETHTFGMIERSWQVGKCGVHLKSSVNERVHVKRGDNTDGVETSPKKRRPSKKKKKKKKKKTT